MSAPVIGHTMKRASPKGLGLNRTLPLSATDADYIAHLKARCTITETGCWECAGFQYPLRGVKSHSKGYVDFSYRRQRMRVHRVSYLLHKGPIPDGMEVCHECDNPPCCNPDHLFLGTGSENALDRVAKKRDRNRGRTHCIRGHELAGENLRIRPTPRGYRRQCLTCEAMHHKTPERLAWQRAYQRIKRGWSLEEAHSVPVIPAGQRTARRQIGTHHVSDEEKL